MKLLAFDQFDFAIYSLLALFLIPCAYLGVTIIRRVVRCVNRRDDPRYAKNPGESAIDVVEFVLELEDKFKIAVPDEDYEKIKTVADARRYFKDRHGLT